MYIVDHWTVGSAHAAEVRFLDPSQQVSAHYLVRRDGSVEQFVKDEDTAWHSGGQLFNYLGLGIEHEHVPGDEWPIVQLDASAELHRELAKRWDIPLLHVDHTANAGVLGHRETGYATQCPGDLPIDAILQGADMSFKDDPDAVAYREDVRASFEAVKAVLAQLADAIKNTEIKAVVEAILSVKPETLRPAA